MGCLYLVQAKKEMESTTERVAETAETMNIRSVSRVSMTAAGHQPQE